MIGRIRKYKSDNNISLGKELGKVEVKAAKDVIEKLKLVEEDVKGTGKITEIVFTEDGEELELVF